VKRYYYRCSDCCSVTAIEAERAPVDLRGSCGGAMELMGEVRRFIVWNVEKHAACDSRCTGAGGPSCNCSCGGANHGTGAVREVLRNGQGIPTVSACDVARGDAFRSALDAARSRYKHRHARTLALKSEGSWVDSDSYWAMENDRAAISHARGLKSYSGRMKALAAVCADTALAHGGGEVRP
jgi:hypothetical protein